MNQLKRDLNRSIKRVSIAVLILFLILLVNVNYLQAVEAPSLANGQLNDRTEYDQTQVQRGNIVTQDGVTIAGTKQVNGGLFKYRRTYSNGPAYAPVTGYDTIFTPVPGAQLRDRGRAVGVLPALRHGQSARIPQLHRHDHQQAAAGRAVVVTINSKAQLAAYQGLEQTLAGKTINGKQQVGGVVALNPSTGAILAMASYPSYDPNQLTVENTGTAGNLVGKLSAENPSPLINNATQTTLPPGSTFKIVTSSAWYGQDTTRNPNTAVYSPQPLKLPNGNLLNDDNDEPCGDGSGHTPVITAFAESCNTPFANIGVDLGGPTIRATADKYGFNTATDIPGVTVAASQFTAESDASLTAWTRSGSTTRPRRRCRRRWSRRPSPTAAC